MLPREKLIPAAPKALAKRYGEEIFKSCMGSFTSPSYNRHYYAPQEGDYDVYCVENLQEFSGRGRTYTSFGLIKNKPEAQLTHNVLKSLFSYSSHGDPFCCGVAHIGLFHDNTQNWNSYANTKLITPYVYEQMEKTLKALQHTSHGMAATVHIQNNPDTISRHPLMLEVQKELRFKPTLSFYNPNSGNYLTSYSLDLNSL